MSKRQLIIFSILAMLAGPKIPPPAKADYIYNQNDPIILLIGIKGNELAPEEYGVLQGKKIIEVANSSNIQDSITNTNAREVIIRQNSGFVGLYSPNGILVKSINLADGSNPTQKVLVNPHQTIAYRDQHDYSYPVGGRIDPYQAKTLEVSGENHARLAPGWGYNSHMQQPKSKRSALITFLNFAPLDTVTPINYPGTFDQWNLTAAYGLGVIPHLGGLFANMTRAKADQKDYEYYKMQQPQAYIEAPTTYYRGNYAEPSNPINTDPNYYRMEQPPLAFQQQYPNF
ncbi:MAG: hypothetical protein LW817_07885 [Candidatus Caenarcaniphilales bacterium]|jgi:hypothetical protein|nr:hypothetical protein [Candidatus Caenarcaniphilales bacterium]